MVARPDFLPRPFAENAPSEDINTIPDAAPPASEGRASLALGFPEITRLPITSGGLPPLMQDINGVLNRITEFTVWNQAGGQPVYNALTDEYPVGVVLRGSDGEEYMCIQANGTESVVSDPVSGPNASTYWGPSLPAATTTSAGVVRRATSTETQNRSSVNAYTTPDALPSQASTTTPGIVELGTQTEIDDGNASRVVTGATLQGSIGNVGKPLGLSRLIGTGGTITIPAGATRALVKISGAGGGSSGDAGTSTLTATGVTAECTGGGRPSNNNPDVGSHGIGSVSGVNVLGSLATRGGGSDGAPYIAGSGVPASAVGNGGYCEFYLNVAASGQMTVVLGVVGMSPPQRQSGNSAWVTALFY